MSQFSPVSKTLWTWWIFKNIIVNSISEDKNITVLRKQCMDVILWHGLTFSWDGSFETNKFDFMTFLKTCFTPRTYNFLIVKDYFCPINHVLHPQFRHSSIIIIFPYMNFYVKMGKNVNKDSKLKRLKGKWNHQQTIYFSYEVKYIEWPKVGANWCKIHHQIPSLISNIQDMGGYNKINLGLGLKTRHESCISL